jgi:hypothetical protein
MNWKAEQAMQKRTNKTNEKIVETAEPIGIVISRGTRNEDAPRFAAYVWGPVPDAETSDDLVAVA